LLWPNIVAALSVGRHGPASSSAALRKMAARSSHGQRDQSSRALAAAAMACSTCSGRALCTSASTWPWLWGITAWPRLPVRISFPPMTMGMSTRSLLMLMSRAFSAAFSGEPGA
jgi:hypothetical protein